MFNKLNWTGDVNHVISEHSSNDSQKNRLILPSIVFLILLCLCWPMSGTANAETLLVDFGVSSNNVVEAGYETYTAEHEQSTTFTTQLYSVFGTTVSVTPAWAAGAVDAVMQMYNRGAGTYVGDKTSLVQDWIGSDTRSAGDPMTLTISGLPAGTYTWLSYHQDTGTGAPVGTFDVTMNDAAGSVTTTGIQCTNNSVTTLEAVAKYEATFSSNGTDNVTVVFDCQPYSNEYNEAWFVMNGFELEKPEPNLPVLYSPSSGQEDVSVITALQWTAPTAYTPTSYDLYLGTNPTVTANPVYSVSTEQFQPADPLENETTYYWAVIAYNGTTPYASGAWDFTTVPTSFPEFTGDNTININDLAALALEWLLCGSVATDVTADDCVNLKDYSVLSQNWLYEQTEIPLVYSVENTGAGCTPPSFPAFADLPVVDLLTDPFEWSDGSGRSTSFINWPCRRNEIKEEIEQYEIGSKPDVDASQVTASYSGGKLTINVTANGQSLSISCDVSLPSGPGPFPAVIGMNSYSGSLSSSIFSSRNVAMIKYSHNQVTDNGNYFRLYPSQNSVNTGQYAMWAWGVSRIIDGLEKTQGTLPIDIERLAVTGCSYAGKMALFAGAYDERIALTIVQESGGGGAAAWRVSKTLYDVETLCRTNSEWFANHMWDFCGHEEKLPHDHHELMAMCAPRALLVFGNTGYNWLAEESGYVSCRAAQEVYFTFGIPDRFGFVIEGGNPHCSATSNQNAAAIAFVEKFLLGDESANTDYTIHTFPNVDYLRWYKWWGDKTPPGLPTGLTATAQSYNQIDLDWNDNSEVDFSHYKVWRSTVSGGAYSHIATVTDSSYSDADSEDRLSHSTTYYYVITSVDHAGNGSANSLESHATTNGLPDDTDPPTPNPATWTSVPQSVDPMTVTMTATAGSDLYGPVQYFFEETSGNLGGVNSGWQFDNTFINTGLWPATEYTYRVRMRDDLGNVGAYSTSANVTTLAGPGPFQESGGIVSMEAENGLLGTRWITGNNTGASNGQYIEIDPAYNNTGSAPECTTILCIASYDFDISTAGNYGFWFRTYSDNANDDSFFWRINSGNWVQENGRSGVGSWYSTDNAQVDSLSAGSHTLEIAYRENGTRLDKFVIQLDTLTAPSGKGPLESDQGSFQESGGIISMEAENGLLGTRWITGSNTGASNGRYIEIDPAYNNTGSAPECTTILCIASYDFDISTAGNYGFWFRTYSDNANDDSFFWRINSGNWVQENGRSGVGSWYSTDNAQVDSLSAGSHTLEIAYRENGTRLDKFVIQLDSLTAPSGNGPAESSQNFGDQVTDCLQVKILGYRLLADLNGDCEVEIADLVLLTNQWLSASPAAIAPDYSPDLAADNQINLADFAAMADQWLICNDPEIIKCIKNW